ncbi:MAG TPA: LuxR C-terminal-related transcriptional regulator, partial [Nevskiaceae bacterium]|nr:LuxR C-terminal-related transcriptional regulator [Nevskiaceae bacterium]
MRKVVSSPVPAAGTRLPPAQPPWFAFPIVRTQLFEALTKDAGPVAKVVSVVAPTGYGKTVLSTSLFEHFRGVGVHGCWVPLDDRDDSLERVLGVLESALGDPESEVHPTQVLISGDRPLEARVQALLDRIALLPEPSLVCLDNLGYCTDETLAYLLDRLVFRTPRSVSFLFSSTQEIPFNASRAKLEGRLREVRSGDLSLTPNEIRDLLGAELCARLGDAAVQQLVRQTEGWPAAVRLAQIILSAAEQPLDALARFSGADEDLADLLNRQALAGFPPEARAFLLAIAPLRSFCVELCRHATGDEDAARHVSHLLRRNVFMIPLDRNRNWYRLHGLFREFLVGEAERALPPEHRQRVLERAAEWFERAGDWPEAIDYALAGNALDLASRALDRVASVFVRDRGDLRQFIEWIEQIQSRGGVVGWEADLWYVWALVFHRRYDTARVHGDRLARRFETEQAKGGDTHALADLRRRVELIRICADVFTDRLAESYEPARKWLAGVASDDPFNVATVACAVGIFLSSEHRFTEARQAMRGAQAAIGQANSAYGVGWVSLLNAMISVYEGDFAGVHDDLIAILGRARATLGDGGISGTISLVASKCAIEMTLDDEAADLVAGGLRWAQTHGIPDTAAFGLDAALKLWPGADTADLSIGALREIAASYSTRLNLMLSCMIVQRLVRLGRLEEALAEAAQIGLSVSGESAGAIDPALSSSARGRDLLAAAQVDLLIAGGQLKRAEVLVAEETKLAKREGRHARLVELALCEVAIAICSHNPQPAARHLTRAVSLASRRRILRPFRDRGELIAGLVNDTKPQSWGFATDEERRCFVEVCRMLPLSNAGLLDQIGQVQGGSQLRETPTARELELLGLIEAGLSNQQLADRLNVSVATVKWHLYNLYAKLGVSIRSAALA